MLVIALSLAAAALSATAVLIDSFFVNEHNKKHVEPEQRLFASTFVHAGILAVFLLAFPRFWFIEVSPVTIALLLGIGIFDGAYNILYHKALSIAPPSKVVPLVALSPIFILLLSFALPHTVFSWNIVVVVLLISIGVYLTEHQKHDHEEESLKSLLSPLKHPVAFMAITAALFSAIGAIQIDYILERELASEFTLLLIRMIIICSLVFALFRPTFFVKQYSKRNWLLFTFGGEIVYVLARVTKTIAIGLGNVALVSAAASTSPLFIILFEFAVFRKKVKRNVFFGTLLIVAGLVILVIP